MISAVIIETDQNECFDESGQKIPCNGTGQDGAYKKSAPRPIPRFLVKGEIVEDRWTGLTWIKNAALTEFPLTWKQSLAYIDHMNTSGKFGHSSWKLPSKRELFSLVSHQNINPSLPENHPFINVFTGYYWTSTSCMRLPNQAWYVHFGGGCIYRGIKPNSYMVWPVSSHQAHTHVRMSSHKRRFISEDETVIDRLFGLMWLKNADLTGEPVIWAEALKTVARLNKQNFSGYRDWRLPNIRQLESLTSMQHHSPALQINHPFQSVKERYWSSTTSVYESSYAWVLYTVDGAIGVGFKPQPDFFVWAVRGCSNQRKYPTHRLRPCDRRPKGF